MDHLLHVLLTAELPPAPIEGLDGWWRGYCDLAATWPHPFDHAVVAGTRADRLGYAFASGYQAAGEVAFGAEGPSAFCATEAGGAHPRAIATRLQRDGDGWRLDGRKTFVTFGSFAHRWLVVASVGEDDHRKNRLRVVDVGPRTGTTLEPHPPTPFVPEVPHAALAFEDVRVEPHEVLEGDGYDRYLKPFRTLEDIHVHGAILGWLITCARRAEAPAIAERGAALALALRSVSDQPPSAPETHIALAGVLAQSDALLADTETMWPRLGPRERERWERDRPLFAIAAKARARRREAAWRRLG